MSLSWPRASRTREMAEKMFISEQAVSNHLHDILDKLGGDDEGIAGVPCALPPRLPRCPPMAVKRPLPE